MSAVSSVVFSGGGTGGHLYPALNLASALKELRPEVHPYFVGAERGIEARILPERGWPYCLLPVEGFRRGEFFSNLSVLLGLARGLARMAQLFQERRPDLVVVTGGYAGAAAGLMAILTGTRLVLQEQNALPGITTRFLSLRASEIHLAFPEARDLLPRRLHRRIHLSGNPVAPPLRRDAGEAAAQFGLGGEGPVLLIVGGSQGSEVINRTVLEMLTRVTSGELAAPPEGLRVLWATGAQHYEAQAGALRALGSPGWVQALPYIVDMSAALSLATLAISRAGAMGTAEFLAWGTPAILIPLPTAADDHQRRNAEALAGAGVARHLPQDSLTPDRLWGEVMALLGDEDRRNEMARAALSRGEPHAARKIAASLARQLPPSPGSSGNGRRAA